MPAAACAAAGFVCQRRRTTLTAALARLVPSAASGDSSAELLDPLALAVDIERLTARGWQLAAAVDNVQHCFRGRGRVTRANGLPAAIHAFHCDLNGRNPVHVRMKISTLQLTNKCRSGRTQ